MTTKPRTTAAPRRRLIAAGAGLALALGGAAAAAPALAGPVAVNDDGAPPPIADFFPEDYAHPSAVRLVSQLTGTKGLTPTLDPWRIGGTDLGTMWDNGDGEVLFAIGDTFGNWSGSGGGGGDWRSNALLRSSNTNWADTGMTFDSAATNAEGKAREIIPSLKIPGTEHTTIPTGGISVDGRQYLSFMSVNRWGVPGEWFTNYARIAYSDDNGETWNTTDGPQWDNNAESSHPFQMVGFTHGQGDGYVYMFGTENGRFGPIHVARVAEDSILEKDAYSYWDGTAWVADDEAAAAIVPAPTTELSVQYNSYIGKWMLMYTTDSVEEGVFDIVFRTADEPQGPWSDVTIVGTSLDYPGMYAPYMHPWNSGPEVHFSMSLWGPYNVFQYAFTLDEDGNLINPNLIQDPTFSRSAPGAMSPAWSCNGNCGIDHNPAWAYGSEKQAWQRFNAGWIDLYQEVTVEPNTDYLLTGFITTGPVNPPVEVAGELGVRPTGPGVTPLGTAEFTTLNGYKRHQVLFNSGPYETLEAYVGTHLQGDRWVQSSSYSLVKVGGGEVPAIEVTPPAPVLEPAAECGVEPTVLVPEDVEGVEYVSEREGTTVTVTAIALEGYVIAEGADATWEFDVTAEACPSLIEVTPSAPVLVPAATCGVEPTVALPEDVEGVEYVSEREGTTVTVTAVALEGYVIAEDADATWEFDVAAEVCPTDPPTDPTDPPTDPTDPPTDPTTTSPAPTTKPTGGGSGGGLPSTGAGGVAMLAVLATAMAGTGLWLRRRAVS